jgi:predicted ATPase
MIGASLHFLGDQAGARQHIERMLKGYVTPTRRSDAVRFRFDQRVTAHITLARTLWLQGFGDQAMRDVESNIEHALSINHTLSLCNALALGACPIAVLAGELSAADRFIAMLLHHAERHALDVWHAHGRCFKGDLLLRQGDVDGGLQLLRTAIDELREARFVQYHTAFLRALAEGFAAGGQVAPGLAAIDEALAQSERNEERWCLAEELRIKGELLRQQGARDAAGAAEAHFVRSLDLARRQGALSWELRAATSLAKLWRDQARAKEARELLAPTYDRFTEGFATADLRAAKALIEELS